MTSTTTSAPRAEQQEAGRGGQLATRLSRAPERWGWEFVAPNPPAPFPHPEPIWHAPPPPDVRGLEARHQELKSKAPKQYCWAGGVAFVGLLFTGASVVFGLLLIVGGVGFGAFTFQQVSQAAAAITAAHQAAAARHDQALQAFTAERGRWQQARDAHDRAERERCDRAFLQFPLGLGAWTSQVNVFGGAGRGWECLLATVGCSTLAAGTSMLVIDFSEQDVAASLGALARGAGMPVGIAEAPAALAGAGFLDELDHHALAEVLADAFTSMRQRGESGDLSTIDVDLLGSVLRRLEGPISFARLAAGTQVLRSAAEDSDEQRLSPAELRSLTGHVDTVDKSERVRDRLRFLAGQLQLLATCDEPTDGGAAHSLWPQSGLAVIRTVDSSRSRKDLTDRVLFHLVVHYLAERRGRGGDLLVVAGADHLGRDALESFARQARRSDVRLVYLFEHLRDDTADLLGGNGTSSVFMHLGNAKEANLAAEHVGREHQFQLSQISRQLGTSETRGTSTTVTNSSSTTNSVSETWSEGRGRGGRTSGYSYTEGSSHTTGTSVAVGESFSIGTSQTDGQTLQRSYDFQFEPTAFQALSPSCFVLVDAGPHGRRAVAGDFNPAMVLLDRVSSTPRLEA